VCVKIFDRLRIGNPDFVIKVKTIDGRMDNQSLGISTDDCDWKNVNFVFHCAATVKFHETLYVATKLNIQGTDNVLALAAKMNYLKVIENRNGSLKIIFIKYKLYSVINLTSFLTSTNNLIKIKILSNLKHILFKIINIIS